MLGRLVEIVDTINTQFMDRKVKNSHNIYVSQDILNIRNDHKATNKQSCKAKQIESLYVYNVVDF